MCKICFLAVNADPKQQAAVCHPAHRKMEIKGSGSLSVPRNTCFDPLLAWPPFDLLISNKDLCSHSQTPGWSQMSTKSKVLRLHLLYATIFLEFGNKLKKIIPRTFPKKACVWFILIHSWICSHLLLMMINHCFLSWKQMDADPNSIGNCSVNSI